MLEQPLNALEGQLIEFVQRAVGNGTIALCGAGAVRADRHPVKQRLSERIGLKRRRIG